MPDTTLNPSAHPASPSDMEPYDGLLDDITVLGNASLQQGAHLLVMREVLLALCAHMPAAAKSDVAQSLRAGIEHMLAISDDRPLPEAFSRIACWGSSTPT